MSKQLAGLDIGSINPESYMHPLFIGLAEIFGSTPTTAKYRLLLATFTLVELLGTLFFAIGSLFAGSREFTLQDLQAMEAQQCELKQAWGVELREANSLPLEGKKKPANVANSIANDVPTQNDPNRKSVGGVYACDACGTEYTAKTVWQRYCPTCSQANRKNVLKRKKDTVSE